MKKKKSISYAKWGYIFILPFFITFLIFSLIPLVDTVRYSFYEYYRSGIKEIGPNFIGIANYLSLLKSDMLKYSANTLILWVIGFVPQIVQGAIRFVAVDEYDKHTGFRAIHPHVPHENFQRIGPSHESDL